MRRRLPTSTHGSSRHRKMSFALSFKRAALDLVVELCDIEHGETVVAALRGHGFAETARPVA